MIASVGKVYRNKAERLIQRLKLNPRVKWNELGELEYDGRVINQSNLTDLVKDVLRKSKAPAPTGWDVFADALRQVNVAQDLVGNPKRWDYIRKIPTAEADNQEKTPGTVKSKRRRYQEVDDVDDGNDDTTDWSTPQETAKKRGRKLVNKRLNWSA